MSTEREDKCENADCLVLHGRSEKVLWCVGCLVTDAVKWGLAW